MLRLARPLGNPGKRGRFSRNFDIKGKKWVHNTGKITGFKPISNRFCRAKCPSLLLSLLCSLENTEVAGYHEKFARSATL